jgi:DNA topoisomerase-1
MWNEADHPRDGEGQFTESWVGKVSSAIADARGLGRPGMKPASDADLKRFKEVTGKALPPAWTDVHIADDLHNSKLLAQGKDQKGRLQSVYSAAHTEAQAAKKFARITELMKHLDKLDSAVERDAIDNDHAAALMLIRRLGMRPGSDRNTGAEKAAHGATNLRAKHVKIDGDRVSFDFTGKKGVHIQLETEDPEIAAMLRPRLARRSGDQRLLDTNETKTREYMKTTGAPPQFLLKDLRTVRANVVALREINRLTRSQGAPASKAEFRRQRKRVAEVVSAQLGNTPALALASYINPTVFGPWVKQEDWV